MTLLLGGNSATWGFTARCQAAAEVFGPAMMVWLASAGPQDAAHYPNCVHFLRLDNWTTGEGPAAYVQRQTARIQPWHTAIPNLILIPGNESDREAGHGGESIQKYADALRAAFSGVKVANVPLTVANTANATYAGCDVAVVHSYFERQHPEDRGNPLFGRSYRHAQATGLTTYVTEFNVVQTNCPIDWPDRNLQAAAWLDQAEGDGVAGAAFFILDAAPDWASYDVGPEAARDILAHRKGVVPATATYLQFVPLSWTQYQDIINHGSFPNVAEPMLNLADYSSLIAVMTAAKIDPRLPLAFTWAEGHDGTDPGLVAASVNNFGGIKFSGAPGTYDSKIPADTGGTYAGFPDLTAYWHEWVRIMNNSIIGPSFNSGDLVSAVEHYTDGPGTGHNKVDKYNEYVAAYPADGTPPPVPPPVPPPTPPPVGVSGAQIVAAAMRYVGMADFIDEGSDIASYYHCQEFVEVVQEDCGLPRVRFPDANSDCDSGPLSGGIAPAGALVFFKGAGWSVYGHVGIAIGDGRTISALSVVSITDGWQTATGYQGWRYPVGVGPGTTEDDMALPVDGKADDGLYEYAWKQSGKPLNKDSAFWAKWLTMVKTGVPIGTPTSEEFSFPDGRTCQTFSSGAVMTWVNVPDANGNLIGRVFVN